MTYPPPPVPPVPAPPTDTKATVALVLGVVSLCGLGLVTGIPAVVLGLLSRRDIRRSGGRLGGAGLALGGIVTGVLGTLWSLVVGALLALFVVFANDLVNEIDPYCEDVTVQDRRWEECFGPEVEQR